VPSLIGYDPWHIGGGRPTFWVEDEMAENRYWSRATRNGLSRRKLLLSTGAAGTAAALAACGGKSGGGASSGASSKPSGAASQIKQGGTLTFGATDPAMWKQTDAHKALIFSVWHWIGRHALKLDPDSKKLQPLTIASWEIPGDGSEFIFKVNPNAKIQNRPPSNGRNFTAEDLAWNLMRNAGKLDPAHAAEYQRNTTMYPLDHVDVIDQFTAKAVMSKPSSTFLAGLTEAHNEMMPKDYVEANPQLNNIPAFAGHGPFQVKSYEEGGTISFVRHPNYMLPGLPYVDQIDWITLPDAATKVSAFVSGKIDMYEEPLKEQVAPIKASRPDAKLMKSTGFNWYHFRFQTERAPFTDPRVRRALFLALDYKEIADGTWGEDWSYTGPLSPKNPEAYTEDQIKQLPGYNESTKDKDRQTAKQLMAAAGYPDGEISFTILPSSNVPSNPANPNSIRAQDQWKKVWPKMDVKIQLPADTPSFNRLQTANDFQMVAYTNTEFPDPALQLAAQWHTTGGLLGSRNYGRFKNAEADAMIEKALVTIDSNARKQILQDFQKKYFEEWMPLIHIAMAPDRYFVGPHFGNFENLLGPWWFINFRLGTAAEYFSRV
jgi:ABC-type transport system substrate-binding protein